MDRPKVIEVLNELMALDVNAGDLLENHAVTVQDALLFTIKELENYRWIPVEDKLPEEEDCYLVTTTGTYNDIIDIACYVQGIWNKASRIKAWMPLPKPYEGRETE